MQSMNLHHAPRSALVVAVAGLIAGAANHALASAPMAEVRTSDVDLFYAVYDAAHGAPTAEALQKGYLDAGSDGVRQFIPQRIKSAADLAAKVAEHRAVYDRARECMQMLPVVKAKLAVAFRKLARLDPEATFPPVTILIGRENSGGTTGKSGVLIGLEVACRPAALQPDRAERLFHLIAHEYGHVEQFPGSGGEDLAPGSVLRQSLVEGGAELIAQLISGQISNVHLLAWTKGREREIDEAFLAEQDSQDLSHWLYNGLGTPQKPGDLGYWVGYRITKAYYSNANDKRAALKTLLELKDPKAILAASGWKPGDAS
jgi:hypothetical protein